MMTNFFVLMIKDINNAHLKRMATPLLRSTIAYTVLACKNVFSWKKILIDFNKWAYFCYSSFKIMRMWIFAGFDHLNPKLEKGPGHREALFMTLAPLRNLNYLVDYLSGDHAGEDTPDEPQSPLAPKLDKWIGLEEGHPLLELQSLDHIRKGH